MAAFSLRRWSYVALRLAKDAILRIPGISRMDSKRHGERTGPMFDPEWVVALLEGHLRRLREHGGALEDLRALELGPGNSLAQSFLLCILGAERCTAVDVRRYATEESGRGIYGKLLDHVDKWVEEGRLPSPLSADERRRRSMDLMQKGDRFPRLDGRLRYEVTDGDMLPLDDASVGFVYSCSVLEHVRDVGGLYGELARVVAPGGLCSHIIDLKDHHHPEPLDFLRYGDKLWSLMQGRSAGFTNRLRSTDHLRLMTEAGFEILHVQRTEAEIPPARESLAQQFHGYSEDELRTLTVVVTARRTA